MDTSFDKEVLQMTNQIIENLQVVDEDQSLKLYSYTECSKTCDDLTKLQRSVVKDTEGNLVAISLPYTDEYIVTHEPETVEIDLKEYNVYPSVEGTLMRVFHHKDKWYITTNRKLDAFKSYWSSHFSFGQLFVTNVLHIYKENNIESFFQRLDTNKIYFFLLKPTTESRIVCHIDSNSPSLYFVGTLNKEKTLEEYGGLEMDEKVLPEIARMESITFDTVEEMMEYVKNVNVWQYQGVILFHKSKNKQIKFMNEYYKQLWGVRNNNPNLFLRYFEIRKDKKKLETFFKLYPKFVSMADRFENEIIEVGKHLHHAYVERYIRKQYVSLPKQEYVILKKAHDWHNENRDCNRIYRMKVMALLEEENPIHLYHIIKKRITQIN